MIFAKVHLYEPNRTLLQRLLQLSRSVVSSPIFGSVLAHLTTANRLLRNPQVKRSDLARMKAVEMVARPGSTLLLEGKGNGMAFELFLAELQVVEKGLIITRTHPDQVRERYDVAAARVLWLCGQPGEGRVDPLGLSILQNLVIEHVQKNGRSLILLDGLEYLISENQVDKVLRMLYTIRDTAIVSGSKLIVPLDPKALSLRDLAFIEREFAVQVDHGLDTERKAGSVYY